MPEIIQLLNTIDNNLLFFVKKYGTTIYLLLFFVVYAKTAFIVTPFFPADSLLFASGALVAIGALDMKVVVILFLLAAIAGDSQNYAIGRFLQSNQLAKKIFFDKIPKAAYVQSTNFIARNGDYAVAFNRFVPLIRTFIPAFSALANYPFKKFVLLNAFGATLWVTTWLGAGYLLGNIPLFAHNLSITLFTITLLVMTPTLIGFIKSHKKLSN